MNTSKIMKKLVSLLLVVVLVFSLSATAFAYNPLDSTWTSRIQNFTRVNTATSGSSGPVKILQRFLSVYDGTTRSYIYNAGGVDGYFGTGTYDAVRSFQSCRNITADGDCGINTWTQVAKCLFHSFWVYNESDGFSTNDNCPYGVENSVMYAYVGSAKCAYYTFAFDGTEIGNVYNGNL